MAKRTIPLFVIDTSRLHGLGDCDFISCTDIDNGFVARVDFLSPEQVKETSVDNIHSKIVKGTNGFGLLISVIRNTGCNYTENVTRTLLKKASETYVERTFKPISVDNVSIEQQINFIDMLIKQSQMNIVEAGSNVSRRETLKQSVKILLSIKDKLDVSSNSK